MGGSKKSTSEQTTRVVQPLTKLKWTISIQCFKETSSTYFSFVQFLQSVVGCIQLPSEKQMEVKGLANFLNVIERREKKRKNKKEKEKKTLLEAFLLILFWFFFWMSDCLTKICRTFSWLMMNQVILGWYFVVAENWDSPVLLEFFSIKCSQRISTHWNPHTRPEENFVLIDKVSKLLISAMLWVLILFL